MAKAMALLPSLPKLLNAKFKPLLKTWTRFPIILSKSYYAAPTTPLVNAVLQTAFGWSNAHMHGFDITSVDDETPNFMGPIPRLSLRPDLDSWPGGLKKDYKVEREVTLADVYEKPDWKDNVEIFYEYDYGDG